MEQYITHKINKDGMVEINASGDGYNYVAILEPRVLGDRNHIFKSQIDTRGIEDAQFIKDEIIQYIQKNRGCNDEEPLLVDND